MKTETKKRPYRTQQTMSLEELLKAAAIQERWNYDLSKAPKGLVYDIAVRIRDAQGTTALRVIRGMRMNTQSGPWMLAGDGKLLGDNYEVYAWRSIEPPPYPEDEED